MTCGCDKGDDKKACDKNFTRAVVKSIDPERLIEFRKVVVPASLGDDVTNPPLVGKYCNVLLYYEANDQVYIYSSDGIPTKITVDVEALKKQIKKVSDDLETETSERKEEDQKIWDEIEVIEAASDVVDVVGTYAELQAYDTSKLHDNDLIKVLQDETRDDAITYYRWNGSAFTYVGAEGPYYTATETDTLLGAKQDKIVLYASLGSYTINENDAYINTPNFSGFFRDSAKTTIVTGRELYNMFASGNSVAVHCATGTWGTLERVFDLDEGEIYGAVVFSGGGFSTDKTFRFTISETTGEPLSESVPGYYNRLIQGQMQLTAGDGVTITDRTTTSSGTTHIQKVISATGGIIIYSPSIHGHRFLYSDRNMTDKITWEELSALTGQASSNGKTIYIKTPGDPDVLYEAIEFYGGDYELTVVGRNDTDFSFLHITADEDSQTQDEYIITETGIQNKLVAGSNISIAADGKTISATDTTYTAGTGISISAQNVISSSVSGSTYVYYDISDIENSSYVSFHSDAQLFENFIIDDIYAAYQDGPVILVGVGNSGPVAYGNLVDISENTGDYALTFYVWQYEQGEFKSYRIDGLAYTNDYRAEFTKTDMTGGDNGLKVFYYDYDAALAASDGDAVPLYTGYEPSRGLDVDTIIDGDGDLFDALDGVTSAVLVGIYENSSYDYYIKCADIVISSAGSENYHLNIVDPYLSIIKDELQTKQIWKFAVNPGTDNVSIYKSNLQPGVMVGATSQLAGTAGLVPAPTTSDVNKVLAGDGTWVSLPSANNISSNDWSGLWQ